MPTNSSDRVTGGNHEVEVLEAVRSQDVPRLSDKLRQQVVEIVARLYNDPEIGVALDPEDPKDPLPNCFKVKFDEDRWAEPGKPEPRGWRPDYRLVYRHEPNSDEIAIVAVAAIAHRRDRRPYELARQRLSTRDKAQAPPKRRRR